MIIEYKCQNLDTFWKMETFNKKIKNPMQILENKYRIRLIYVQ